MSSYTDRNRGRLAERTIRGEIAQIQADLRSKTLKFTGAQRFKLHERIEALQAELKQTEIERIERALEAENGANVETASS